ncbi:hypothetical protein SCHPADRAFT_891821 [Schizopora paradoxa]|uniref:Uncharacterized protein n=1 Tax=Schizopora paradoxa TaxID=27342 RepID=A0A0H2RNY4_9AGAM|nr:hypothetical protein SCHPADRAFT_891821 [Schizopora paradoxa]
MPKGSVRSPRGRRAVERSQEPVPTDVNRCQHKHRLWADVVACVASKTRLPLALLGHESSRWEQMGSDAFGRRELVSGGTLVADRGKIVDVDCKLDEGESFPWRVQNGISALRFHKNSGNEDSAIIQIPISSAARSSQSPAPRRTHVVLVATDNCSGVDHDFKFDIEAPVLTESSLDRFKTDELEGLELFSGWVFGGYEVQLLKGDIGYHDAVPCIQNPNYPPTFDAEVGHLCRLNLSLQGFLSAVLHRDLEFVNLFLREDSHMGIGDMARLLPRRVFVGTSIFMDFVAGSPLCGVFARRGTFEAKNKGRNVGESPDNFLIFPDAKTGIKFDVWEPDQLRYGRSTSLLVLSILKLRKFMENMKNYLIKDFSSNVLRNNLTFDHLRVSLTLFIDILGGNIQSFCMMSSGIRR